MKEIIPKDDYGVFVDGHDVALVDDMWHSTLKRNTNMFCVTLRKSLSPNLGSVKNFRSTILWSQLTRMQAAKRIYAT